MKNNALVKVMVSSGVMAFVSGIYIHTLNYKIKVFIRNYTIIIVNKINLNLSAILLLTRFTLFEMELHKAGVYFI